MADGVPPHGWEGERSDGGAFGEMPGAGRAPRDAARAPAARGREQVTDLIRGLLLVLRALIDWLVAVIEERSGVPAPAAAGGDRVEDIPIA